MEENMLVHIQKLSMHSSNVHTKTITPVFHEYSCKKKTNFHLSMVICFPHESLEYIY